MLLMTEMSLMFKAIEESLHIITIIVIISFILILCVLILLTRTAALAKIGAGKAVFFLQDHLAEVRYCIDS